LKYYSKDLKFISEIQKAHPKVGFLLYVKSKIWPLLLLSPRDKSDGH